MSIDGGMETQETGSADFAAPELSHLKAIGDWGEQTNTAEEKRAKDRNRLYILMMALVALTTVAISFIRYLIAMGKTSGMFGWSFFAWGWIVAGLVMAAGATVMGFAADYWKKYGFGWMSGGAMLVGFGCAMYALLTAISGAKQVRTKDISTGKKVLGIRDDATLANLKGDMVGGLKRAGGELATKAGQQVVQEIKTDGSN